MRCGYFDDDAKGYVITRPDTPQSWSNYLGSTEYGAIITNNASGYGFYQSGARGRFLRLRFNSVPMDQPGRNFYLRDGETGDSWSASWQSVGKPLDHYKSTCRHGLAYSVSESCYASRDAFPGPSRGYHSPPVVEQGQCTNSNAQGDNACGSL